ncbi:MAG: LysR family transcriptional regulator [Gemmatimonadaceae bacterium]
MADPELSQLRAFVVLGEELHFGNAADRLRVAQPALSQQIRRLESRIGFQLFNRTSRRVSLTPAGQSFLARARVMLDDLENAIQSGQDISRGQVGTVRVGYVALAMLSILPAIVRDFRSHQPGVRLTLHELSSAPQIDSLMRGELDVAVQTGMQKDKTISCFELRRDPLTVILPRDHPHARSHSMSASVLRQDSLIIFPRRQAPALYDEITSICRKAEFTPMIAQEAQSWHMIAELVSSGIGVAIGPQSIERYRVPGIRFVKLKPGGLVSTTICLNRITPNPAAELFVETARKHSAV